MFNLLDLIMTFTVVVGEVQLHLIEVLIQVVEKVQLTRSRRGRFDEIDLLKLFTEIVGEVQLT